MGTAAPSCTYGTSETQPTGLSPRANLSGSEVTGDKNLSGVELDVVHFDWVSLPRLHERHQ